MSLRRAKLLSAIKSAQTHINPSSGHQPIQEQSDADNYSPKSKLAKLTGKSGVKKIGNHCCQELV